MPFILCRSGEDVNRIKMETLLFYTGRAVQDMAASKFLNLMTIMTIALCTLVVSSFALFYENGNRLIRSWSQGGRVVVYLNSDVTSDAIDAVQKDLESMEMTEHILFISKERALDDLKDMFSSGKNALFSSPEKNALSSSSKKNALSSSSKKNALSSSFGDNTISSGTAYLESIKENPLPDSFIVNMKPVSHGKGGIETFSEQISDLPHVESVEYGQTWIERVERVLSLFKISGSIMIILFCIIALFVVGNTVRLSLYVRQEEFVIMRLVGATERFMAIPFYIVGIIQGGMGALAGLVMLAGFYTAVLSYSGDGGLYDLSFFSMEMEFLSPYSLLFILSGGVFLSWIGCFFSLKQYLNN